MEEVFTQEIKEITDTAKGQDAEVTKAVYNAANAQVAARMKRENSGKAKLIDMLGTTVGNISQAISRQLWEELGPQDYRTLQTSLAKQQVALIVEKITATMQTEQGDTVKVKSFADLCQAMLAKQQQCFGFGVSPEQSLKLLVGGESEAIVTERNVTFLGQLMPDQDLTDPAVRAKETVSMQWVLLEELGNRLEQKVDEMASMRKRELEGTHSALVIARAKGLVRNCHQLTKQLRAQPSALS